MRSVLIVVATAIQIVLLMGTTVSLETFHGSVLFPLWDEQSGTPDTLEDLDFTECFEAAGTIASKSKGASPEHL